MEVQAAGLLPGQVLELGGVEVAGVGEPGAELRQILPPEGGLHEDLDLVGDEHQVPGLEVPVHPAGGVGDQEGLAAQQAEDPDGVADLLVGVALVVVDPALHHCHRLAGQGAEDQLPLVSRGGGGLKVGDGGVGDGDGVLHQVPQVAQAGAQDQGHPGPEVPQLGQQGVGALAVLVKGIVHSRSLPTGDGAPGAPGRSRGAVLFFCTIAYWVILHHGERKSKWNP